MISPKLFAALSLGSAILLGISASAQDERIWHVKAIHPEGRLLDVKAIDKDGKAHGFVIRGREASMLHLRESLRSRCSATGSSRQSPRRELACGARNPSSGVA